MSEIKVNSVVNSTGDNDSGLDLSPNDVVALKTANTERLRVDASGKIGIGATTIDSDIHLEKSSDLEIKLERTGSGTSTIGVPSSGQLLINNTSNADMLLSTNNTERLRIKNGGNVLVGTTDQSPAEATATGVRLGSNGGCQISADGQQAVQLNRTTDDGATLTFRKDGTVHGHVGVTSSGSTQDIYVGNGTRGLKLRSSSILPRASIDGGADNVMDIGSSASRFDDVFATNTSIQTSDKNEKQDIEELNDAEKKVAVAVKSLMRKYRWKSAVTKKGDKARTHFGIIAQDLQDAFTAEGLDASKYAMFCSDTWWEKEEKYIDDDGKEQTRIMDYEKEEDAPKDATKITRLGVRYSELLAFIISAI